MASVEKEVVKEAAKKVVGAAAKAVASSPRRIITGARVAMLALTGITGGGGYLGYQFFATPGADLSQATASAEADKKPSLIPADFVADKPAKLIGGGEAAAPWAASKETAPVVAESPWTKANVTPVNDAPIASGPTPPPVAPDAGRRTFNDNAGNNPGFNGGNPLPPDPRTAWQQNDPGMTGRMPGTAAPLTNDFRNPTGNSLRSTSPTVPSTGNSLETRPRTFATNPGVSNTPPGSSRPNSTYSNSLPSNSGSGVTTGQRYARVYDPCCNVVRCVPVNPCNPTTTSGTRPALDSLNKSSVPRRLSPENSAATPRSTVTPTAHLERGPQPTPARTGRGMASASGSLNTSSAAATEIVLPDDSYWTIAERVYGDGEYYRALQEYHLARGVRRLEVGDELKMPEVGALRRMYPQLVPPETYGPETRGIPLAPVSRTEVRRLYTVADGDTLREIAARELGDPGRALEILDRNRPALEQSGYLRPGMELVLPGR